MPILNAPFFLPPFTANLGNLRSGLPSIYFPIYEYALPLYHPPFKPQLGWSRLMCPEISSCGVVIVGTFFESPQPRSLPPGGLAAPLIGPLSDLRLQPSRHSRPISPPHVPIWGPQLLESMKQVTTSKLFLRGPSSPLAQKSFFS